MAEGILLLLLRLLLLLLLRLQGMGGDGRETAWDMAAAGSRAAGCGGAAGVGAGARQLAAGGAAGPAAADGACSTWLGSVAARDALPSTESLAMSANDDDVGSGRLAPPPLGAFSARGACPAISY